MSKIKRYDICITESDRFERHEFARLINKEDIDNEYVLFADYESERLVHEATKKRLEELEDAINYAVTTKQVEIGDKVFKAITNSRERQEENRLRTKVAKFIDRNGGEAMG